jgi:hypothetical protein
MASLTIEIIKLSKRERMRMMIIRIGKLMELICIVGSIKTSRSTFKGQ